MGLQHFVPDIGLVLRVACPQCGDIEPYIVYADINRIEYRCNRCNRRYDHKTCVPEPAAREGMERIAAVVAELNKLRAK